MALALPQDNGSPAFSWVADFQRSCVLRNGIVPEWFHGTISRKAAEEILMCKPPGYFLIRISESRVGYTLSHRDEDRCRHFMIDMLPDNQYVIVGENNKHRSLHDLVAFHRGTPIPPSSQLLTVACEQGDKTSYAELLFPQRRNINPVRIARTNSLPQECAAPLSNTSGPKLTSPVQNESPTLCTSPSTGLYPCLQTELTTINLQSMEPPIPKPRTICISTSLNQDTPPQLPPRDCLPSHPHATTEADRSLMKVCPEKHQIPPNTPSEDKGTNRNQQKHQQQSKPAIMSLAQIKRKLKKKHSQSEEHAYEEISKDVSDSPGMENLRQPSENDYLRLLGNCPFSSYQKSDGIPNMANRKIQVEYQNPPPFAPGY
ncbi:hematopoietic SH2 domain-containing protein homolog [Misgurnus anguillicaudatus]|uniref:hematopoietic SH2 domain-containing protein homolog n=1 Tax=Misgurnus anguillicaudatus TaxID=75329 RepID=UPI003CCF1C43